MNKNELKMANYLLNEAEQENGVVKIYYDDLDIEARAEVLKAIDNDNNMIDVFGDEQVKANIIETFAKTPLFVINGSEITKQMNFEF